MPLESEVLQTTCKMWLVESNPVEKQILQTRAIAIASTNEAAVAELKKEAPHLEDALAQIIKSKPHEIKVDGGEKQKAETID